MTGRIFSKLILAVLGVLIVALLTVNWVVTPRVRANFLEALERELIEKSHTVALMLPAEQDQFPQFGESSGTRVTWIDANGVVLGDSEANPGEMENHAARPEIATALDGGNGVSLRISPTLGVEMFYVAIPHKDGVLRLAVPSTEVNARVEEIRNSILATTAVAFLPAVFLALVIARYFSRKLGGIIEFSSKLAEGDFHSRLKGIGRGELGILATKLNETSEKLEFMLDRLETEHAEMEKLERVRKDFVINVSHELRTPLASIQGYTETLLDGALDDPNNNVRFLNIIRQNAERLTRLTADLLVLSRIELGQQKFKFASYYANRLIGDNLDALKPIADAKHIELQLEPTGDNVEVFCDAEAVQQILTNLLDNAIKYTPDGGKVTIGARELDQDKVEFYVQDSGLGIPPDDLARLFERFYRVDKARSRSLGGTGLGLAIVKHLTRAQGGDVHVESKVNKGSTFRFTLPVQDLGLEESGAVQKELTVQ